MITRRTKSIADLIPSATARFADDAALSFDRDGRRVDLTYAELGRTVGEIGLGLIELGLERGDHVAILCDTRPEWTYAQLAVTAAGGVVVPIYPSSSPGECQWVLQDSGSKIVICENPAQLAKIAAVQDSLPKLELLIVMDSPPPDAVAWDQLPRRGDAETLWSISALVQPDDPFAIVYTSGTTGKPKGCVLSHLNVCTTIDAVADLSIRYGETTYLFLPLAHVFSLILELLCLSVGARIAFWGGDPAHMFEEIQAVKPSYFPAVPRIFEKVYAGFAPALHQKLGAERFAELVSNSCEVRAAQYSGREVDRDRYEEWKAADEQVFADVRKIFGGKIRQAATGAAPIGREVLEFFYAAGIPVLEGYGMTETATAITMSTPEHWKFGTVGKPLPHMEVRLADDNEILVKGANVFAGYYNNDEATAETIVDGWLHTGDLGSLDDEGYLSITGRKKDLIITATGKNIAPLRIEEDVALSRYVSQAVLHGDRRPYLVMLITLDPVEIASWAVEHGKSDDLATLVKDPDVTALVQAAVDSANQNHAKAAQVKKFFLLDRELSSQAGELTPTLKLKRKAVNERFAAEFDRLYGSSV
jgi:long-chain acyl-CoA synthetase